jgi:hypothetical protein
MTDNPYEVGYKKPPAHGQFQPGQSGNPKGRKKGSKNFSAVLLDEMAETIKIAVGGTEKVLTKCEVVVKAMINKAMNGDLKATKLLLGMTQVAETQRAADDAAERDSRAEETRVQVSEAITVARGIMREFQRPESYERPSEQNVAATDVHRRAPPPHD